MLGYPPQYLDGLSLPTVGFAQSTQRKHRLIGQSCHLPSLCLAFALLRTCLPVEACPRWPRRSMSYGPSEAALRARVHRTVFDDHTFREYPGLLTAADP